jgi:hypothetical protein
VGYVGYKKENASMLPKGLTVFVVTEIYDAREATATCS